MPLKRVFVCSPLRSDTAEGVAKNIRLARELCRLALLDTYNDAAPFAPHAFYTEFLDDWVSTERELGIMAGLSFLEGCSELWCFTGRGISEGMRNELNFAARENIKITFDPVCWEGVELDS